MFQPLSSAAIFSALAAAIALLALPLAGAGGYVLHVMILVMIFSVFAVAYNLVTGYLGLKTFGHHAFFGLGAYGSALISMHGGISPWLSIWLGAGVAAAFGIFVGLPVLRIKSMPHVAIVTLAFAEIVRIACSNLKGVTRGELGLWGIPTFGGFDLPGLGKVVFNAANKTGYYYLAAGLLALALVATAVILRSKVGLAIFAIRDGEDAAESLGVNLTRIKLFVFGYSAFVVGAAGGFYAHYVGILTPSAAIGADVMIMVIAMTLVGGLGSFTGPLIGALLLTSLGESLRFLDQYRLLVYGAMIVMCVMFAPRGLASLGELLRRPRKSTAA
ncbi:branched-chain amino acid ABC transporter permease [Terrarubrum flagellatum]|uniref:branched-chain amino acid ABC transporter permease n=1 Tax=Terrirubrum flagellatum TaxID=2895980 RepID=UPI0031453114